MADLQPYVCTDEACDMKLFGDAQTWFAHELQNHLVEWHCCFCETSPFTMRQKLQSHIVKSHGIDLGEHKFDALSTACQKPRDQLMPSECRICDTWEQVLADANAHIPADRRLVVTPRQFCRHVAGHMEQ